MIRGGFRVLTLAFLVLAIFAVFACASPTPAPTPIPQVPTMVTPEPPPEPAPSPVPVPTHGVVNFHIISHQTGRPIVRAEVNIDENPFVYTDERGNYSVDLPYLREVTVIVYHGEYHIYRNVWVFNTLDADVTIALDSLR